MPSKNIVILGAGFGGIRCALDLEKKLPKDWSLILIDKNDYHLLTPWLYEVATAYLSQKNQKQLDFKNLKTTAAVPIKEIIANRRIQFLKKEVSDVLTKDRIIVFSERSPAGRKEGGLLKFDYLVFALGSKTNYFNIPGLYQNSFGLKDINDALNLRNAVEEVFFKKERVDRIRIVIGGGGFTGIEFAGELVGFLKKLCEKHHFSYLQIDLIIIEAASQILPGAKKSVIKLAQKRLKKLGIKILFNNPILDYQNNRLVLKNNDTLKTDLLIWTAGVMASEILESIAGVELRKSCLAVNDYLQLSLHSHIYGIGDNVICFLDEEKEIPLPATAQAAMAQAKIISQNILRSIKNKPAVIYSPKKPGFVIPIGGKYAIADLKFIVIGGFLGWLVKILVMFRYLLSILPFKIAFSIWLREIKTYVKND